LPSSARSSHDKRQKRQKRQKGFGVTPGSHYGFLPVRSRNEHRGEAGHARQNCGPTKLWLQMKGELARPRGPGSNSPLMSRGLTLNCQRSTALALRRSSGEFCGWKCRLVSPGKSSPCRDAIPEGFASTNFGLNGWLAGCDLRHRTRSGMR
jgi:hypothetical protein